MRKQFKWNSARNLAFLVVFAYPNWGYCEEPAFHYFGTEIDFWHQRPAQSVPARKQAPANDKSAEPSAGEGPFPWNKYLDPKNREFFKEGEYTPPEPFMEIVRNPTDANLKNWFAYIDKKNELTHKLQERMQEYLAKNGTTIDTAGQDILKTKVASLTVTAPDAKRFRFRMYFDSHCPHCRKMFETLADLQSRGFYVEAKQIDSDPRGTEGLSIPVSRVTPGEIKEKDIQSVPVLLIGDLEKKQIYRLTGYQSTANVFAAIAQSHS